ncbi:MAG: Phasin, partial [Roseicyclus sp.]
MATKTPDYTKMMTDMMGSFPMDMSAMNDAFKSSAAMGEKMSKVILDAAEKSTEISSKWTKDTLAKMGDVTAVKSE